MRCARVCMHAIHSQNSSVHTPRARRPARRMSFAWVGNGMRDRPLTFFAITHLMRLSSRASCDGTERADHFTHLALRSDIANPTETSRSRGSQQPRRPTRDHGSQSALPLPPIREPTTATPRSDPAAGELARYDGHPARCHLNRVQNEFGLCAPHQRTPSRGLPREHRVLPTDRIHTCLVFSFAEPSPKFPLRWPACASSRLPFTHSGSARTRIRGASKRRIVRLPSIQHGL